MQTNHMKRSTSSTRSRVALLALVLAAAVGCGASSAHLLAFNGPFSAKVLPAGPAVWSYQVSTNGNTGIVSIEVISSADLSDAHVTTEPFDLLDAQQKTDEGLQVLLDANELRQIRFTLTGKNYKKGFVYLKVTDSGGIVRTVGPVAGPVQNPNKAVA